MEKYEGSGKLVAFTLFCLVVAVGLGLAGGAAGLPAWAIAIGLFVMFFLIAWILRRRESGRWGYAIQRYTADARGRRIELLFDERMVMLNRLTMTVDGEKADSGTIFYGTKTLTSGAGEDGVSVTVGSGWVGVCTGAVARSAGEESPMRLQSESA